MGNSPHMKYTPTMLRETETETDTDKTPKKNENSD
jgi:hypothetical protein